MTLCKCEARRDETRRRGAARRVARRGRRGGERMQWLEMMGWRGIRMRGEAVVEEADCTRL